jgi:glycosyltransferase involved in cell wall biosynthesis
MSNDNYKIKVSIIVVSYNAEKYIERTIKSCLNQTYQNIEVLLLDNASGDKTVDIVKKIQSKRDCQLNVFESEKNLGPYGGLNFLLEKAEGEYIAIQDHDDIWFPKKIAKQVEFLKKNRDFIACGTNTFYFYEDRNILILNKKPEVSNFVDHTSLVFRNKNFKYNTGYVLTDEYFEKKILSEMGKIACIQNPLTIHRIKGDGTNLSSSRFKFSVKNVKDFFEINGFNLSGFLYFFDLAVGKYFSNDLKWFIRKNITQKKSNWLKLKEFKNKYPQIEL